MAEPLLSQPAVSVIVPAFNAARWIGQTIESVLAQSFGSFELIVVDDGSTDDTATVVQRYCDARIRYIRQENKGLPGARNTGIRHSAGGYLAFLDADDLWHEHMLRDTVNYLDAHPEVAVVRTGWYYVDAQGSRMALQPAACTWTGDVLERLLADNAFIIIAALMRRACVEAIGLFDETLRTGNEDWDFWLRLAAGGNRFGYLDAERALYRRHGANMSSQFVKMRSAALTVLDRAFTWPAVAVRAGHLRGRAYGRYLSRFCVEAFRNGLESAALEDLAAAVMHDPAVAGDVALYYQIACASVPPGVIPAPDNLDLACGERNVLRAVDTVERRLAAQAATLHGGPSTTAARAAAELALGMVFYTYSSEAHAARRYLLASLAHSPSRPEAWRWLVRGLVGKERLRHLRHLLTRTGTRPPAVAVQGALR